MQVNEHDPGETGWVIEMEGVSRTYREGSGKRVILERLDFRAQRGQFVAIGGPSGSGKSTLLNLMAGLDVPDSGTIRIGGENLAGLDADGRTLLRRRRIGVVFQFFNLVPTLTVRENLHLPLALNGIDTSQEKIDRLLREFDLDQHQDDYPETLSGGEQQRVAVLRAAVHEPAVILADEPTGNLDRERGNQIVRLLGGLASRGTSVIMVTHSRRAAESADRRLRINEGKLVPWAW